MSWPERPLGELFEVHLGKMLSPKAKMGSNPKPYLRNVNVQWGHVDISDVAAMDFLPNEMERFRLRYGDLLVCEGGEIGRAAIWKEQLQECYYQKALHRLRPKSKDVDPNFALYFFSFCFQGRKQFVGETGQTTIAHLPKERLERLPFPLPPLLDQNKIAAILSSVDDTSEKTQAVIDQLEAVKKTLLGELLTRGVGNPNNPYHKELGTLVPAHWQILPLDKLLSRIDAGWSPQCESRPAADGEWGVLKVSAVSSGTYTQTENKALPESMEARPDLEVRQGDVLVTRANGVLDLVGRSAYVHRTRTQLMLSDKTLRLRPLHEQLLPYFLHLLLGFEPVRAQLLEGTTGSHMRNISQSAIRRVIAPIPPLIEQTVIADTVMAIENRIATERKLLTAQKELKNGLLDALFSGRIWPSAPEQEAA